MYDFVYSITSHENVECLADLILNIKKYNKNNKFLIVIHGNNYIKQNFINTFDYVILNEQVTEKGKPCWQITDAHIQNFLLLQKKEIQFKTIVLLASNCMFTQQIPNNLYKDKLIKSLEDPIDFNCDHTVDSRQNWWWPTVYEHTAYVNFFKHIGMRGGPHEGCYFSYELFDNITKFILKHKIDDIYKTKLKTYWPYEETVIPSLEYYFTGHVKQGIIYKAWQDPIDIYPTVENFNKTLNWWRVPEADLNFKKEIQMFYMSECAYFWGVKRVPRDMNHPYRKYINSLPE